MTKANQYRYRIGECYVNTHYDSQYKSIVVVGHTYLNYEKAYMVCVTEKIKEMWVETLHFWKETRLIDFIVENFSTNVDGKLMFCSSDNFQIDWILNEDNIFVIQIDQDNKEKDNERR